MLIYVYANDNAKSSIDGFEDIMMVLESFGVSEGDE